MAFPEKKCQFASTASTNSLQSLVLQGFELVEAISASHSDPTLQSTVQFTTHIIK